MLLLLLLLSLLLLDFILEEDRIIYKRENEITCAFLEEHLPIQSLLWKCLIWKWVPVAGPHFLC